MIALQLTTASPQIAKHGLPPGIELVSGDDIKEWKFDIRVLDSNPLYNDQTFRLKFVFGDSYPIGWLLFPPSPLAHEIFANRRLDRTSRSHV